MKDEHRDPTNDRRTAEKKARDERLAATLRANLKRRKAAARHTAARQSPTADTAARRNDDDASR